MKQKGTLKKLIVSFVLSIIVFSVLLIIETNVLKKQEKVDALQCVTSIPAGTLLTKENLSGYVKQVKVDKLVKPDLAVTSLDSLNNQIVKNDLSNQEIVNSNDLVSKDSVLAAIQNPIEVSIKTGDLSQVVGGILREGDVVDVSVVNVTSNTSTSVLNNAYITKAFATDGTLISRGDVKSAATVNLIIDKSQESLFNEKLSSGSVRLSKVTLP